LIVRLKSKDEQAWQRLVHLYGPLVYYWCRQNGLESQDSVDVFQDVFAAVSRGIDGFRGGRFRSWLWTITRNKLTDHFRRREAAIAAGGTEAQIRLREIPEQFPDDSTDPDAMSETVALVHRCLNLVQAEFEDRTWQAFWRATVEGHSTADIAADLGISVNGVRQAKSRVLRRVREELGDDFAPPIPPSR
jgi:RNA polymerase sigma-70 factor (ECF subfamily)